MPVDPKDFSLHVGGTKTEAQVAYIQLQNLTGEVLLDAVRNPQHYAIGKGEALKHRAGFLIERDRAATGNGRERGRG